MALSFVGYAQNLREEARRGPVEVTIHNSYDPVGLGQLVSDSDTIVVGEIRSARALLVANDRDLVTDSDVTVDRVLKRTAGPGLVKGDTLVVRRDGGVTELEGNRVIAIEEDFPELRVGEKYLLFLKSAPTGVFYRIAHGPEGAFAISGNSVRQVSEAFGSWNRDRGTSTSLTSFVDELRSLMK
jgi:hypothetical protein